MEFIGICDAIGWLEFLGHKWLIPSFSKISFPEEVLQRERLGPGELGSKFPAVWTGILNDSPWKNGSSTPDSTWGQVGIPIYSSTTTSPD